MAKIIIDTDRWITPKLYAELTGLSQSAITKQMKEDRVTKLVVPEIGVKLVERPNYKKSKK